VSALPPAASLTLLARDGRALQGLLLPASAPRAALLVNSGTGFRREFYLPFAAYAAARGYHTLVYDYRGIGASARTPLRTDPARMIEWARLDMPAALSALAERFASLPLFILGHSVGGQLIGCMPNHASARAYVMIACSSGYWGRLRRPFRYQALAFWKLYGPLHLALQGYVPRGVFWRGTALPAGVFRQWRTWCLSAAAFGAQLDAELDSEEFAAVRAPILSLSFSDDDIATPAAVEALLAAYRHAPIERRVMQPQELGVTRIGHHGFFAERHRESLWRGVLDWLDGRCD
jgi:predicted alpha/beta hydrolase